MGLVVRERLKVLGLPREVAEVRVERTFDSTGEPAGYLYVLLRGGADYAKRPSSWFAAIEGAVSGAWRERNPEMWPYVHFRTVREQALLDAKSSLRQ